MDEKSATNVWAIKLGSGGRCVPFCERHQIVGVGWRDLDERIVVTRDRDALKRHLASHYPGDNQSLGSALGQLWRFAHECQVGDYVLYYDPPRKRVQVARVTSEIKRRTFEPDLNIDVWFYRDVALAPAPIPIVDFYGGLKGSLLGPRMSFWQLDDPGGAASALFVGKPPGGDVDPEVLKAYDALKEIVAKRAQVLDAKDWEWVVADYLIAQGARVDERRVGGNQAVIDVEAHFDRGELGEELWRVQVKRHKGPIDWPTIADAYDNRGDCDRFAFVSVSGFTTDARANAAERRVVLLEGTDFTRFLLSGKLRPRLRERLRLPFGPVA